MGLCLPCAGALDREALLTEQADSFGLQELEREGLCATQRGLGTFVTESRETIEALREEMACQAVSRFLSDLTGLGLTRKDAIELIQKEEINNDHE